MNLAVAPIETDLRRSSRLSRLLRSECCEQYNRTDNVAILRDRFQAWTGVIPRTPFVAHVTSCILTVPGVGPRQYRVADDSWNMPCNYRWHYTVHDCLPLFKF